MMMKATVVVVVVLVLASVGVKALDVLDCGQTTMSPGERVAIQSPNFPKNYDNSYR